MSGYTIDRIATIPFSKESNVKMQTRSVDSILKIYLSINLSLVSRINMPTPICKLKRVNQGNSAPSTTSTTVSKTLEEDAKKLLEARNKQDQRYFPTLHIPSRPRIPGALQ
jgi:hypothetical protein